MRQLNYNYLLLLLILSVNLNAQYLWQIKSDTIVTWYFQSGDEFNGTDLNTEKWKSGLPWGNVAMSQDLYFNDENVVTSDGKISFISKKEKKTFPVNEWEIDKNYLAKSNKKVIDGKYEVDYTSGLISSKETFKYGYFELRFKSTNQKGIWPAFWLFGGEPSEEIDFFELKGERENQLHLDMHCQKGCDDFKGGFLNLKKNWGAWLKTDKSLADNWNVISGEWQPNYVKFFLNGQPIGYFEGNFKTSKNLIINSSVAKDKQAFNPGPDKNTKWPNSFDVDYVRIWSNEDTIYKMKYNYKLFENTPQTIEKNDLYSSSPKGKSNFIYDQKQLNKELGTISILPIFYNKYSLSIAGKKLGKIQIDVMDRFEAKVAGFELENVKYYILDLSALPTGPYNIKIKVLNKTIIQNVPVLNANKMAEEK
jgi:beta-glucanase (GH16 family)